MVIGKRGHLEVEGPTGDFPSACIIEHADDLAQLPHAGRLGVISQTTQPLDKILALVAA